ncbi:tyrosine-type recombinase/integrase [Oscillospiraceae bacterium PP1C4]
MQYSDFDFVNKTISIKRAISLDTNVDIKSKKASNSVPLVKELKNERKGKINFVARRVIRINDEVLSAVQFYWETINSNSKLVAMRQANDTQEFLFTAPSDGKIKLPNYYLAEYRKELKRNGIDSEEYNMYRFRHNYCTRLVRDLKLDIKTVARMMGDSSVDMVMRVYQSVHNEDTLMGSALFAESMSRVLSTPLEQEAV